MTNFLCSCRFLWHEHLHCQPPLDPTKLETSSFQRFGQIYPPEHMVFTKVSVHIGYSGESRRPNRFIAATDSGAWQPLLATQCQFTRDHPQIKDVVEAPCSKLWGMPWPVCSNPEYSRGHMGVRARQPGVKPYSSYWGISAVPSGLTIQ